MSVLHSGPVAIPEPPLNLQDVRRIEGPFRLVYLEVPLVYCPPDVAERQQHATIVTTECFLFGEHHLERRHAWLNKTWLTSSSVPFFKFIKLWTAALTAQRNYHSDRSLQGQGKKARKQLSVYTQTVTTLHDDSLVHKGLQQVPNVILRPIDIRDTLFEELYGHDTNDGSYLMKAFAASNFLISSRKTRNETHLKMATVALLYLLSRTRSQDKVSARIASIFSPQGEAHEKSMLDYISQLRQDVRTGRPVRHKDKVDEAFSEMKEIFATQIVNLQDLGTFQEDIARAAVERYCTLAGLNKEKDEKYNDLLRPWCFQKSGQGLLKWLEETKEKNLRDKTATLSMLIRNLFITLLEDNNIPSPGLLDSIYEELCVVNPALEEYTLKKFFKNVVSPPADKERRNILCTYTGEYHREELTRMLQPQAVSVQSFAALEAVRTGLPVTWRMRQYLLFSPQRRSNTWLASVSYHASTIALWVYSIYVLSTCFAVTPSERAKLTANPCFYPRIVVFFFLLWRLSQLHLSAQMVPAVVATMIMFAANMVSDLSTSTVLTLAILLAVATLLQIVELFIEIHNNIDLVVIHHWVVFVCRVVLMILFWSLSISFVLYYIFVLARLVEAPANEKRWPFHFLVAVSMYPLLFRAIYEFAVYTRIVYS